MQPKRIKIQDYRGALNQRNIRGNIRALAEAICKRPGLTALELVTVTGLPINIVSGRAADLKSCGLVVAYGTKEMTKGHKSKKLFAVIPTAKAA